MDKKSILITAVLVLALLLWWPLMSFLGWNRMASPQPPTLEEPATVRESAPPAPSAPERDSLMAAPETVAPETMRSAQFTPLRAPGQRRLELVRPNISRWQLDAEQGGVLTVVLQEYRATGLDESVSLGVPPVPLAGLAVPMGFTEPGEIIDHGPERIVLRRRRADGLVLVESWQLQPEALYEVTYRMRWENTGAEPIAVADLWIGGGTLAEQEASGGGFGAGSVGGLTADMAFADVARPETMALKKVEGMDSRQEARLAARPLHWVAVHTKYFVFYMHRHQQPFTGIKLEAFDTAERAHLTARAAVEDILLQPGATAEMSFQCYAGPKQLDQLRQLDTGADSILHLDLFLFFRPRWMGYISRGILRALLVLNDLFQHRWGYGFAIIIVTVVIKMLFWPLTHKSTVSMRRMQKLQPLMQELREKYSDDAQQLNRKMMELYREHKVNPVGGCLPIFFQIPVFFALFNTLRGAIELRQAEFLWASDLSEADTVATVFGLPIRPFALLMAISMVLQQHATPQAGDPSQRRMMMFMSVFFIFILYGMPSGLTLYWTVNQVLTMLQYAITRRLERDKGVAESSRRSKS